LGFYSVNAGGYGLNDSRYALFSYGRLRRGPEEKKLPGDQGLENRGNLVTISAESGNVIESERDDLF